MDHTTGIAHPFVCLSVCVSVCPVKAKIGLDVSQDNLCAHFQFNRSKVMVSVSVAVNVVQLGEGPHNMPALGPGRHVFLVHKILKVFVGICVHFFPCSVD